MYRSANTPFRPALAARRFRLFWMVAQGLLFAHCFAGEADDVARGGDGRVADDGVVADEDVLGGVEPPAP
jgi:hypothetical protein